MTPTEVAVKGRFGFLIALLVLASVPSYAQRCCNPCFDPCCKPCYGRFEGGGELLLMTTSSCDALYAIADPRTYQDILDANSEDSPEAATDAAFPQLNKHSIRPAYHFGFRAWISWVARDCLDGTLEYMRLHTRQNRQVRPDGEEGLWPTFAHPNQIDSILYNPINQGTPAGQLDAIARARAIYDFDSLELQFARRATFGCGCRMWTRGFMAVHYFNLDHSFRAVYQGTKLPGEDGTISNNNATAYEIESIRSNHLWGVGPVLGIEGIYNATCGIGLAGRLGVGVLAGDQHTRRFEHIVIQDLVTEDDPIDERMDVFDTDRIQIVPRLNARLGVNLTTCFSCALISVELGYEFITYLNAIRESVYIVRAVSNDECENFNMQGPYLRLLVGF